MKLSFTLLNAAVCIALASPAASVAQQSVQFNSPAENSASIFDVGSGSADSGNPVAVRSLGAPQTSKSQQSLTDRWLDLNSLSYATRYRSTFDSNGAHTFSQGQQRIIADGTFKFDADGRYGLGFHLSSGRYFNWAYADFIGGGQDQFVARAEASMTPYQLYVMGALPYEPGFFNSGGGQLYLRQAFLKAEPIRGINFEFGGFGINHGVNSEATSYDDDGYMSGERVTVRRPKNIWLSEVSYTRGFLGDLYTPNFFARGQRLSESNYWQILGRKDFGKRVSISADYTYSKPQSAVPVSFSLKTTREAIFANVHESKVIDSVRFEAYQRINGGLYAPGIPFPDGKGYAVTVSRSFKKMFSLDGGIANIDTSYITNLGLNVQSLILGLTVNGDQYGIGKRYFVRPTVPLTSYMSLAGNYNRVFDTNLALYSAPNVPGANFDIWNARVLTAGLVFDVKSLINTKKKVF